MALTLVEGWTSPITLVLRDAGVLTDLSGATVELRIFDNCQNEFVESGALAVEIAVSGQCLYTPDAVDFLKALSPYYVRVEVTDAVGDVSFYPSAESDIWTVRSVSA